MGTSKLGKVRVSKLPKFWVTRSKFFLFEKFQSYFQPSNFLKNVIWISVGRAIGAFFLIPFLGFLATKKMSPQVKKRTLGLAGLLAFQGGLGWYMVKSGLEIKDPDAPIRVSPYRLCAHLGTAFLFLVGSLWTALDISMVHRGGPAVLPDHRLSNVLRKKSMALAWFTFFVAMSGAFVAGNDAGLIYGTYPKMADRWIPEDYWYKDGFMKNVFENAACVQFNHRWLAHGLITGIVTAFWLSGKGN